MGPVARQAPARAGGHTLIEVMVVVVIFSVLAALVVLGARPGGADSARHEALRLAALLELAMLEGGATGQPLAWSAQPGGYAFWRRSPVGEWVPFPEVSEFRGRQLGDGVELRGVRVDARPLAEGERVVLSARGFHGFIDATVAAGATEITVRTSVLGRASLRFAGQEEVHGNERSTARRLHAG